MISVEHEDEISALVWFNYIYKKVIECHAVSSPEVRGRWLTQDLFDMISTTIKIETDCTACIAQIHSPGVARLWKRFGFEVHKDFAILNVKDP